MSEQAILDTIYLDMKVKLEGQDKGKRILIMAPGNYGLEFLKEEYGIEEDQVVKCSNFIGQSIDMAAELKCDMLLLAGHIGKLIKVAGGIMGGWADGDSGCRCSQSRVFSRRSKETVRMCDGGRCTFKVHERRERITDGSDYGEDGAVFESAQ